MHRATKDVPAAKRLPLILIRPVIRFERPEVHPHPRLCMCRFCKKYSRLLRRVQVDAIRKER
jgi:hypothetical protein